MPVARHEPLRLEAGGREVELDVGRLEVVAGAHEPAGLGHVRGERAAPLGLEQRQVLLVQRAEQRDLLVDRIDRAGVRVVVQVQPDLGQLGDDLDLEVLELGGTAEAGEHQELRRVVGAPADDHLALRAVHEHLRQSHAHDADRALALEQQRESVHVGLDGEVGTVHHGVEVRHGGARPRAVPVGHLVPADAVLLRAVEVLVRGQPLHGGRVQERLRQRVARAPLGHRKRAAGPVVVVLAALVVLGELEVGEHLVPGPARAPLVVVDRVAPDVDHRVDRRRAAEHLPAREVDAAVVRERLVDRRVIPVLRRPVEGRERDGQVDQVVRVRSPGLEQQHVHVRVLGQAVGEHTAG